MQPVDNSPPKTLVVPATKPTTASFLSKVIINPIKNVIFGFPPTSENFVARQLSDVKNALEVCRVQQLELILALEQAQARQAGLENSAKRLEAYSNVQ